MAKKYNWGLEGHDKILSSLEKDIQDGNVTHAYLFAGPSGVGKFTAAKVFANILQCGRGYCKECNVCKEIAKGYHADTIVIPDDGESIKIEQIRAVIDKVNMTKTSPYKILLVKNIERMTAASGNALLKTLEDPPENVVFILTANNLKDVLPTITSRTRLIKFKRIDESDLYKVLETKFPDTDRNTIEKAVFYSRGKPGKAVQFMNDPGLMDNYGRTYEDIQALVRDNNRAKQFLYAGGLAAGVKEAGNNGSIFEFFDIFENVLHRQMLMNVRGENAMLPLGKCVKLLQKVQEARTLLKGNINARLLLENLMLHI